MSDIDVSLILNIHDEILYLKRTLKSIEIAAKCAFDAGLSLELVAVLDCASNSVADYMKCHKSESFSCIKIIHVKNGSLGPSRNDGIRASVGKFVMTCDADDLISNNMITSMYAALIKTNHKTLIFPEYYVYFGQTSLVRKYFPLGFLTPLVMLKYHPYGSRIFAHRGAFSELHYRNLQVGNNYAYEDWDLNCDAISRGYDFMIAPQTVIFYRKKRKSLSNESRERSIDQIPKNKMFQPENYLRTCRPFASKIMSYKNTGFEDIYGNIYIRNTIAEFLNGKLFQNMVADANKIDPCVSVKAYYPEQVDLPKSFALAAGLIYFGVCELIKDKVFTDVFLLPSVAAGGSEKYLIQIMESLVSLGSAQRILVVCYDRNPGSVWADRLPLNTTLVELGNFGIQIDGEDQFSVVIKIIQALDNRTRIHLKTSGFLFEFYRRGFGVVFNTHEVIYYRFCDDRFLIGDQIIMGPTKFDFVSDNFNMLNLILCDHQKLIDLDRERIGVELDKWVCLPAYCEMVNQRASPNGGDRFLWASRLTQQKNPIMLILISEILCQRGSPIMIDIYGGSSGEPDAVDPIIFEGCTNIKYMGTYSEFDNLEKSMYVGLVYTTMYDGLPNVILEAMASGLPVIAPACDGIPEVVQHGETGFIVSYGIDNFDIATEYCDYIEKLQSDTNLQLSMSLNCFGLIKEQYSRNSHRKRVREIFGIEAHQMVQNNVTDIVARDLI